MFVFKGQVIVQAHSRQGAKGGDDIELTQEDIKRIRRVWKMREAMSDNTYYKQFEASL